VAQESGEPAPVEVAQASVESGVAEATEEEADEPEPWGDAERPPLPPEEFSAEEYEAIYAAEQADRHPADEPPAAMEAIVIRFTPAVTEGVLYQVRHLLERYPGSVRVLLEFMGDGAPAALVKTHPDYGVTPSDSFMQEVRQLVGEESVRLL
jgi:hypothetical protein